MNEVYDCVVIGTGGMGSAALHYAARRGWSVLGLDRFPPGHDRGSSHGQTRIIRQAYFEHPDYVPLALDAYRLWDEIAAAGECSLIEQTGLLQVGRVEGPIIGGIRKSADQHGLKLQAYTSDELSAKYPMFRFSKDSVGLVEPVAGFLRVEECVKVMANLAVAHGATLRDGVTVNRWQTEADGTHTILTDAGEFRSARLIVTAGPWSSELLGGNTPQLKVIAKHQHWFQLDDPRMTLGNGCPTFFFETPAGYFYGFPDFDGNGNKIAEHGSGGDAVIDPLNVDRNLELDDLSRVQEFVADHIDAASPVHVRHSVCMYTMSSDEHFIIDTVDQSATIAVACGLSGHGFKFARIIGQALVEMLDGNRRDDMKFLRMARLANNPRAVGG